MRGPQYAPAPRYRLTALDVDGTLLNPEGHVSPRTARAVRQALACGVHVILCTGRRFSLGIRHLSAELGLSLPAIVRNGAAIQDSSTGAVLYQCAVPEAAARAALDVILKGGTVPVVEEGPLHGEGLFTLAAEVCGPAVLYLAELWMRTGDLRHVESAELLYGVREPSWIGGCGGLAMTRDVFAALSKVRGVEAYWTGDRLGASETPRRTLDYHCAAVMPAGCSKAAALARFAAEQGIPLSQVMAVGDYYNDVELLTAAGWGVAMGHAPGAVKAIADAVVPDHASDGAAVAIERYVLGLDVPEPDEPVAAAGRTPDGPGA